MDDRGLSGNLQVLAQSNDTDRLALHPFIDASQLSKRVNYYESHKFSVRKSAGI